MLLFSFLFFYYFLSHYYKKGGFLTNPYFYKASEFFLYYAQKIIFKNLKHLLLICVYLSVLFSLYGYFVII